MHYFVFRFISCLLCVHYIALLFLPFFFIYNFLYYVPFIVHISFYNTIYSTLLSNFQKASVIFFTIIMYKVFLSLFLYLWYFQLKPSFMRAKKPVPIAAAISTGSFHFLYYFSHLFSQILDPFKNSFP